MIDRTARNEAALLVRRLASGRISPDKFDDALLEMNYDAKDRALDALSCVRWNKDRTQREYAMWVLFLQTDNEYRWPADLWDGSAFLITAFATLLLFIAPPDHQPLAKAIVAVRLWAWYARLERWIYRRKRTVRQRRAYPFFHANELQQARRVPRLLNGRAGY